MRRGHPRHDDILTPREWQVLDLLREGLTNEEIGDRLGIAHNTVKFHVSEILGKLEVTTREEAAAWQGKPKAAFGLVLPALLGKGLGSTPPLKLAGVGAIATALVALVLLAIGVLVSNDGPSLGKIAFVRDGNIWVQTLPDGTPYQLTDKGESSRPQWSSSGEWLLFTSENAPDDDRRAVQWVVRADGSDERLVAGDGFSGYWQPESDDRLVHSVSDGQPGGDLELVAENANGTDLEVISKATVEGAEHVTQYPLASFPEESRHYYVEIRYPLDPAPREDRGPTYQAIWVSEQDGRNALELTNIGALSVEQESNVLPFGWTAGGQYLLVVLLDQRNDRQVLVEGDLIAISAIDGEQQDIGLKVVLGPGPAVRNHGVAVTTGDLQASWTNKRIAVVAPDASGYTMLTGPEMAAISPAWSPDGTQIAFVAAPDLGLDARDEALASRRLYLIGADGTNQRQLTSGEGFRDASPRWSADGKSLFFARTSTEDPCYGGSYDLMRFVIGSGSLEVVATGLPLYGTFFATEIGEVPQCEMSVDRLTTDTYGELNLASVLAWWQPEP